MSIAHDRPADVAVPAQLGQPAHDRARQQEAQQVAAGGAEDPVPVLAAEECVEPGGLSGVDGKEEPDGQVEGHREEAAPQAQRPTDEEDGEGLGGDRHGRDGQRDPDVAREHDRLPRQDDLEVRRQGDEDRAGHDEGDVPRPRAEPLAQGDRDQEVADGDPALGGGQPVEALGREGHRGACSRGRPAATVRGVYQRAGQSRPSAPTISTRDARRAG